MVESGLGATLLPASALQSEVRPGQGLVARSFGKHPPGRTLSLQWRASSATHELFGQISKVLREHYLSLNADIPRIAGPKPRMRRVD